MHSAARSPPPMSRRGCNGWNRSMASLDSAPLRRRLDALTGAVRREVGRRQELRERAEIWAALGPALAEWRIDPKVISGLWTISGAEAELHRRGDCPDLQRADAAF